MKDYLKPNLELSPDNAILHIGTSDRVHKQPRQYAESIVDFGRQIESTSDAKVSISEVVSRRDSFSETVKDANKHLKSYCRQNDWQLIEHRNISGKGLNKGELHLSTKGNEQLFKNFQEN